MKQFDYTIQEAVGIHARPAGLLVKEVKKYKSTVTVIQQRAETDGFDGYGR